MAVAYVYDDRCLAYDWGPEHPLRPERLRLTEELLHAYQAFDVTGSKQIAPRPATVDEVLAGHDPDYVAAVAALSRGEIVPEPERYGFNVGDNPSFPGMYEAALICCGASVVAAEEVLSGRRVAFNIAGGLHHAFSDRVTGFCIFNDPVIAIHRLLRDVQRVVYLDVDAHHGDGVQAAFYRDPRVMTISVHETGETLFPGSGYPEQIGEGPGRGTTVNVPLFPGTDDELYLWAFQELVPPLIQAFRPDVLVAQLGCDTHFADPLANLALTTGGYRELVRIIDSLCDRWVALGGGGYNLETVPRAWALAYAVAARQDLPDAVPAEFAFRTGIQHLNDPYPLHRPPVPARTRSYAERTVEAVRRHLFPLWGLSG
jgi:acetoin utilization protein AcuC